jgi:RNA polymerase sigma-70 factor (ECF subfamily)
MAAVETRRSGSDAVTNTTHELYQRYGRQIYAYCLHKLRSREEAEDAVQTTFMNAFRSLQRGATTEYEQAWLYKIAHNVCLERSTSSARRLRLETPNDIDLIEDLLPSRRSESALELIGIEDALESMPENQRRAILLREWKGLSYREIGEELGLSQAAVEMLIFRARRSLAGALEQPEEQQGRRRAARSALIAGLLGAVKALFGGGAAIKVIGAAAAVVVVGESAQHTIVQQRSAVAHVRHRAAPAFVQARVVSTHRTVHRLVPASKPAPRVVPHVAVKPKPVHVQVHARPAPAQVPVAAPAPAPAPVAAPAPPPPPVERQPAAVPPPAPTPPPAPVVEDPEPEPVVAETPVAPPSPPAQPAEPAPPAPAVDENPDSPGNGHAYGRDKPDKPGKPGKP